MTNSLPWKIDGPNRNRWFTVLKNGKIFHGELLNNQRVIGTNWNLLGYPNQQKTMGLNGHLLRHNPPEVGKTSNI